MSIASPWRMMMLALTIRFCFPPTVLPSRIRRACGRRFQPAERVPNRLAHLGDPQGRSRHRRLQQVQFREAVRPFGKNRRHPEAKNAERAVDAQSF